MLKLCVICHTIGKPYNVISPDEPKYSIVGKLLQDMYIGVCPKCENKNCQIPIDSPRAQRIIKENNLEIKEYYRKPYREKFVWEKNDPE